MREVNASLRNSRNEPNHMLVLNGSGASTLAVVDAVGAVMPEKLVMTTQPILQWKQRGIERIVIVHA